jgi:hypothetical protein
MAFDFDEIGKDLRALASTLGGQGLPVRWEQLT